MFLRSYQRHQEKRFHSQRMGLLKFFLQELNVLSLNLLDCHKVWEIRTILVMKWYCQRALSFQMLRGYHLIQLGSFWTGMELKKSSIYGFTGLDLSLICTCLVLFFKTFFNLFVKEKSKIILSTE